MKLKPFFIIFKGLSIKKITHFLLEDEGPTLRQRTDKTTITKKKLKICPPLDPCV